MRFLKCHEELKYIVTEIVVRRFCTLIIVRLDLKQILSGKWQIQLYESTH
jgi:hypothetical protein